MNGSQLVTIQLSMGQNGSGVAQLLVAYSERSPLSQPVPDQLKGLDVTSAFDLARLFGSSCMNADIQAGRWTRATATTLSLLEAASRATLLPRRECKVASILRRHTRTKRSRCSLRR